MAAVGAEIVDDDLDVVGTFSDAGVDPGLSFGGRGERGDVEAVLGAVAAGDGGESSGGAQIGPVEKFAVGLIFFGLLHVLYVGEHVELGGHAKNFRLFESVAEGVGVRIDQAGE